MEVPSFQVLYPRNPSLSIRHHFTKQICEAGAAQLRRACAIEISVVDCLAVGGGAEAGMLLGGMRRRTLDGGLLLERSGIWKGFRITLSGRCGGHCPSEGGMVFCEDVVVVVGSCAGGLPVLDWISFARPFPVDCRLPEQYLAPNSFIRVLTSILT